MHFRHTVRDRSIKVDQSRSIGAIRENLFYAFHFFTFSLFQGGRVLP